MQQPKRFAAAVDLKTQKFIKAVRNHNRKAANFS